MLKDDATQVAAASLVWQQEHFPSILSLCFTDLITVSAHEFYIVLQ